MARWDGTGRGGGQLAEGLTSTRYIGPTDGPRTRLSDIDVDPGPYPMHHLLRILVERAGPVLGDHPRGGRLVSVDFVNRDQNEIPFHLFEVQSQGVQQAGK